LATLQFHAIDHEFRDAVEVGFAVIRTLKMKDNFIITLLFYYSKLMHTIIKS